ncbi:MAG: DUF4352 domain-containing protein [Oscillospiraceae bacterium]|nr:DUF4352 domain-containing protein [Oscillospiraceae bacterium]
MKSLNVMRRTAVLLLTAALFCSAGILTGCGDKSSKDDDVKFVSENDPSDERSVYIPEVPDSKIDESVPGKETSAGIGSTVDYEGKVTVTLNRVVEIDDVIKTEYRVLIAELTVENKSDKKLDCQTLTHFAASIDGQIDPEAVQDVRAAIAARKYCTKTNNGLKTLNQAIEPGEKLTGYVYLGMPTAWQSLQLVYTPYKYYSNDRIIFDIPESEEEHYDVPLD